MKKLHAVGRRTRTSATWYQTRVQYDSLRRQPTLLQPASSTDLIESTKTVNLQHLFSLLIVMIAAFLIGLSIGSGVTTASASTNWPVEAQDTVVAQIWADHPVETLIGDYWRIIATNQQSRNQSKLVVSAGCNARTIPPAATKASFAYLLTTNTSNPTTCSIAKLMQAFGRPTTITVIAGSVKQPREALVFYDHGASNMHAPHKGMPVAATNSEQVFTNAVRQLAITALRQTACPGHETIVQVVAHEDDDLLFMNPDLLHAMQQGDCIRTIYLTAGDAGGAAYYWLGRERGSEAAYASLAGISDDWVDQSVRIADQQYMALETPSTTDRISLIFLHLPDGRPDGQGFDSSGDESLAKLASGQEPTITSVDGLSTYTHQQLVDGLLSLMEAYQPTEVRTQLPYNHSLVYTDHSDHLATGQLTTEAFTTFQTRHPSVTLGYYPGYPIREQPPNVGGDDLNAKEQAFFTYAQYDGDVCGSVEMCMARGDYGDYLQRQYRTNP